MLSFAETKSLCELAYSALGGESYAFADGSTWEVIDHWRNFLNGFKCVLSKKQGTNRACLSFAGTDSLPDVITDIAQVVGITPTQYHQAMTMTQAVRSGAASGMRLHLAGHSLGGGLAAYCSCSTKLSTGTVNPAPLVGAATFSALFGNNDQITNYIARGGEFVSSSPGRNPGRDVYIDATGNFFTRHSLSAVGPGVSLPRKL